MGVRAFMAAVGFGCAAVGAALGLPALAGERTPQPTITIAQPGTHCIAPPEVMRRKHPDMLKHQRDLTMHEGKRGMPASMNACIACHAAPDGANSATNSTATPAAENAAPAGTGFCENCHAYAAVKLDCFECHAKTPRAMSKQASGGAQ